VVVSGGYDGKILIHDLASGAPLKVFEGHQGGIRSVAVASLAGKAVVISGGDNGTIRLLELTAGSLDAARTLEIVPASGALIELVPDGAGGERLVRASPDAWRHWAAEYCTRDELHMTDLDDMPRVDAA
jgi:eukaryotic-like serine/threonine-protein kinase